MPTSDAIQHQFQVGDIVNVPCVVTAVTGAAASPVVTLTTKYAGFDGNTDSIGPIDANQVMKTS